ncbi:MAG: hypothetical protein HY738_15125, partial [Bacteroidia bacterium]|nr:hypothetical protein [Bacteroidia bacterium]
YVGGTSIQIEYLSNSLKLTRWEGDHWHEYQYDEIPNNMVVSLKKFKDKLYVGGPFMEIGESSYKRIACWNDTIWSDVGGGLTGGFAGMQARAMVEYNGDLIVAGTFAYAGSVLAMHIARWDGSSWHSLCKGFDSHVFTLTVDTINNWLYAGGIFDYTLDSLSHPDINARYIARWDGTKWYAVGNLTDN